jgi:hypothetical protein
MVVQENEIVVELQFAPRFQNQPVLGGAGDRADVHNLFRVQEWGWDFVHLHVF